MTDSTPPLRHVVVLGLMGSGKTTVGKRVAAALGWPLSDSDAVIEAAEGHTVREIRDARGTDALHALERRHLVEALEAASPSVISPAASVVDDQGVRAALQDPSLFVAWLTARPETAAARFDDQEHHRPRYGDDTEAFLADQARRRGPLFAEVADLELATDDESPDELAARIVERVAPAG